MTAASLNTVNQAVTAGSLIANAADLASKMIAKKAEEPSKTIQESRDPIGIAIKVALLYDSAPGTKLSFVPHDVDLQAPGWGQSIVRTLWSQNHNEVMALRSLIPKAIYLMHSFDEQPRKRIYAHIILGLKKLAKTYEKEDAVASILNGLVSRIHARIKNHKVNDQIDKSEFYQMVKRIWVQHVVTLDTHLSKHITPAHVETIFNKGEKNKKEEDAKNKSSTSKTSPSAATSTEQSGKEEDSKSNNAVTGKSAATTVNVGNSDAKHDDVSTATSSASNCSAAKKSTPNAVSTTSQSATRKKSDSETEQNIKKLDSTDELNLFLVNRNKEFRDGLSEIVVSLLGIYKPKQTTAE